MRILSPYYPFLHLFAPLSNYQPNTSYLPVQSSLNVRFEQPIANWAKRAESLPGVVGKWFSLLLCCPGGHSSLPGARELPAYIGASRPRELETSKLATTRVLVTKLATARVPCFPTHHPQLSHCALIVI